MADPYDRLDQISTQWTLLELAHGDSASSAGPARNVMVLRYAEPIRRYVSAIVRDDDDCEELAQHFILRLLKGDFAGAAPDRGRFRDLLKTAIRNMVINHWKKQRAKPDIDLPQISDRDLNESWRKDWRGCILDRTWDALSLFQQKHRDCVYHTVLSLRVDYPQASSTDLADLLTASSNRPFRADSTRQQLRRARLRFAQLLVEEVAKGCDPTPEKVESELAELGLLDYVRDYLPDDWRETGQLRDGQP